MNDGQKVIRRLAAAKPAVRTRLVAELGAREARRLSDDWPGWVREGQEPPSGEDWRVWLMQCGRGFGKTRAGAEWISQLARDHPGACFALVAASVGEARRVMVEGRSGLLAVARAGERNKMVWEPSRRRLVFASGAEAFVYSGGHADSLRGPDHHFAWCDELAKWRQAQDAWDNLMLGLRLGANPRALVTTTPRPIAVLRAIIGDAETVRTGGPSWANPHVAERALRSMKRSYGGTRLGRQELEGELLDEVEGALWTRELIEQCRVAPILPRTEAGTVTSGDPLERSSVERDLILAGWQIAGPAQGAPSTAPDFGRRGPPPRSGEDFLRVVIGVDPPASAGGTCGIVACGLGWDGIGYVLADHSAEGLSPEGWARKVAAAAAVHGAQRVVAEANNGGAMVAAVLKGAAVTLPVRLTHAAEGKAARAAPVATLFESGRAKFAGRFPELEDQLCGLAWGGGYQGPGRSPDRADAMVWAMTELLLVRPPAIPRVRIL